MASQTVYFNNPADIPALQRQPLVQTIANAWETRTPVAYFPLYLMQKNPTYNYDFIKGAYTMQDAVTAQIGSDMNTTVSGWKIGSTNSSLQTSFGFSATGYYPIMGCVVGPEFAIELRDGTVNQGAAGGTGAIISNYDYENIKVEIEMGVILSADITSYVTSSTVQNYIQSVCMGYEIVSGRFSNNGGTYPIAKDINITVQSGVRGWNNVVDMVSAGCCIKGPMVSMSPAVVTELAGSTFSLFATQTGANGSPYGTAVDPTWTFAPVQAAYTNISMTGGYNGCDFDPTYTPVNPFTNSAYEKSPFGSLAAAANKMIYIGRPFKAGQYISCGCQIVTATTSAAYGSGNNYNPNASASILGVNGLANQLVSGAAIKFTATLRKADGSISTIFPQLNFTLTYP